MTLNCLIVGTTIAKCSCNKDASATLGKVETMFANVLMLVLFYVVLVVPVLWSLRPARMVTPF
jgi:hypothetical protein